jgi:hypothetical protein
MKPNVFNSADAITGAQVVLSDRATVADGPRLRAAGRALYQAAADGHELGILRGMLESAMRNGEDRMIRSLNAAIVAYEVSQ